MVCYGVRPEESVPVPGGLGRRIVVATVLGPARFPGAREAGPGVIARAAGAARESGLSADARDDSPDRVDEGVDLDVTGHRAESAGAAGLEEHALVQEPDEQGLP